MKPRARFGTLLLSLATCMSSFSGTSIAQDINTVVGGGPAGGTAKSAFIAYPGDIVRDKAGNTYISSKKKRSLRIGR